jgi:hypothetical protein
MENNFIGPRMPLDIPLFLFIPQEERKQAWVGRGHLPPVRTTEFTETPKSWDEWQKIKKAMIPEHKKAKNARGLAALKEKHAGQKYDRKNKVWVKVVEDALAQ